MPRLTPPLFLGRQRGRGLGPTLEAADRGAPAEGETTKGRIAVQTQRSDRIAARARRALAGAALAALLAGVGAAALPAAASGPCVAADGLDPDRDGLTCNEEAVHYGTDPLVYDTDFDSLGDGDEIYVYGTAPLAYDTDGDGSSDGAEVGAGTDPLDAASAPNLDACGNTDSDADGLTCYQEVALVGTSPYAWDTDGDGWGDGEEVWSGGDPLNRFCDPNGCG